MNAKTLVSPAAEVRRLRAELEALTAVAAQRDDYLKTIDLLWQRYMAETAAPSGDDHAHCRDMIASAYADAATPAEPLDVSEPGPYKVDRERIRELDELRYPPLGRARFGEVRAGDYMGGPVDWEPKAGAVA